MDAGSGPVSAAAAVPNPNLAARLAERAAFHPGRLAIVECRGRRVRRRTYAELDAAVAGVAAGLRARGVRAGDRVLVFVPMSLDLYVVLIAILRVGACAVFVDAWAGRARLDAAVRAVKPRAFVGTVRAHVLRLATPALRAIPVPIVLGGIVPAERFARDQARGSRTARATTAPGPMGGSAPSAGGDWPPDSGCARVLETDAALVTFTTGSSGTPKAAARTHGLLWAQHLALQQHLAPREEDIDLPTLPVFVLNNLAAGVTSVLPDMDPRRPADVDPARVVAQMERERVTTSSGSPAFYGRLATWCEERGRRLPLRALFTGGAPVLPALARLLAATVEGEAHVVYGSTEAEPIAGIEVRAMLEAMAAEGEEGVCVGNPVPAIEVKLVRPHDGPIALDAAGWSAWEVDRDAVGEVVVRGAHVLEAYFADPDADRANKIRDGAAVWHRTGDAARRDRSGRLWLMGRVRRRVRPSDRTWWGQPAELRALAVDGVRHAAYFGAGDPEPGQRAVLCVEAGGERAALEPALRGALAPMPVDELHLLEIPRDPRHRSKTDWEALEQILAGRHPSVPSRKSC